MNKIEIEENQVIMIGECNKFDSTNILCYNKKYQYGSFKGIAVKHRKTCKTKEEALTFAKKIQVQNGSFADGTVPFEIVFHIPKVGYEVASSNLLSNEIHFK